MTFEVGKAYERLTDGMTAVVGQTDVTATTALLRLATGEKTWITAACIPTQWRRYETCSECRGTGQIIKFHENDRTLANRPIPPPCPACQGSGRVYP